MILVNLSHDREEAVERMSSKQKGSGALAEWEDRLNDVMGVVFCIIAYVFLNS